MRQRDGDGFARKPTNVSLSQSLVVEAKALGISLSRACECGLREAVAETRAARWLEENRSAIESWNGHVEANGLPLARFRTF